MLKKIVIMKKQTIFDSLLISFVLQISVLYCQSISFYPQVDTIAVDGGCSPPHIYAHLIPGNNQIDTVFLEPDSFSVIGYFEGSVFIPSECYFLISDTLDEFNYELWFTSYWDTIQYPFDSSMVCYEDFSLKLVATTHNIAVDSLTQIFRPHYGLSIDTNPKLPSKFRLFQNYPNPFNPTTTISYYLPRSVHVEITLFDVLGNYVKDVYSGYQNPQTHEVELDGSNLSSGIYFYRLKTEIFEETRKCILIK